MRKRFGKWTRGQWARGLVMMCCGVLVTDQVSAQIFGIGIPGVGELVHDIEANAHLIEELAQWAITNRHWEDFLTIIGTQTVVLPNGTRVGFGGYTHPYYTPSVPSIWGETGSWPLLTSGAALYGPGDVQGAWNSTTFPLNASSLLLQLAPTTNNGILLRLASAEIHAAMAQNAMLATSNARSQQLLNATAIQNLQTTCLFDDGTNQIWNIQQNCGAAAGVLGTQQTQLTNGLLVSLLDLKTQDAMDATNKKVSQVNAASLELTIDATRVEAVFDPDAIQNTVNRF